ncbi:UNVERIFIED_CONTAM: hypothetical protein Slati_0230800 [Sesamum latifolium]|uniref:Uncharacterized protein n=1 Tax=Sesamum latifolium TaxID=2727402 RepID=A0AAW2YDJ7_9LAMI
MLAKTGTTRPTLRPAAMILATLKVLGRIKPTPSVGRAKVQSQLAKYAAKNVSSFKLRSMPSLENNDSSVNDHFHGLQKFRKDCELIWDEPPFSLCAGEVHSTSWLF